MTLELVILLAACIAAAVTDVLWRKIPNVIPICVALTGFGFAAAHGVGTALISLAIVVAVLVLGTFAFANRWLGGGDIKLLAAVSGALGVPDVGTFLAATSIGGGMLALGIAFAYGRLPSVLRSCSALLRPLLVAGTVAIAPERPITMPYAVAIACGIATVALSHSVAPYLRLPL